MAMAMAMAMGANRMNWVADIKQKLGDFDASKEMEHWNKRSIYRVPESVIDLNKKAYKPQIVSFGPYHYSEDQLKRMELHKHRALLHFLNRSSSEKTLEDYVMALQDVAQELMDSYDCLDPKWCDDKDKFLELMLRDGCFMLEVLRMSGGFSNDYAFNDPIFSDHGKLHVMPHIRRDMLMLQNQLPMLLLEVLLAVETGRPKKDDEFLNMIILKFCAPSQLQELQKIGPCVHVLDVYRKSLLIEDPHKKQADHHITHMHASLFPDNADTNSIRSALKLHDAGIRFKASKTSSLEDISFHGGVLRLPLIVVDDATESTFLNLMAFERSHVGVGNEVTCYVFFMDNIIDSHKDVSLLHRYGILVNAIGSDKAVANLFNSLSKDVTLDPDSSLEIVRRKVNNYYKKRWNEWRANLIHTYFRSPWAILSLLAAIFLMALTIAQTFFSIYPIVHPKDDPPCVVCPMPSPGTH